MYGPPPLVTAHLLAREEHERRRHFVGRDSEITEFLRMLEVPGPGLLYVHGPAGIGKSTLIQLLDAEARRRSARTVHLDGRDLPVAVESVFSALDAAGLSSAGGPGRKRVLFFDTYELMRPIEPEVARELLRRVTDDTLVVLAGRLPPSAQWRALSLWGSRIVPISLCNLSPEEAGRYLHQRGVAAASVGPIVDFSHGHPLALALAAEGGRGAGAGAATFEPHSAIDVITSLYSYFMGGIADARRRAALEVAAVLHTTSEALLGSFLGAAAAELFGWMRELSFMVPSTRGLFPHDLVREVILAELRWRHPQRLLDLALQGQRLLAAQVQAAGPAEFSRRFMEFTYALSHNPRARILMVAPEEGLHLDDLRPGDEPTIATLVARHEGPTALRHAQHWLACQPAAFKVARNLAGEVTAFLAHIRLDLASAEQREQDPLAVVAWRYAETLCGGPPGGPVAYARWYMDAEYHQEPCRGMAVCSQAVGPLFFLPGFALYFVRIHPWPLWEATATLCHAIPVPELAHEVAGKPFSVTVQDHRGLSGIEWLLRFSERATPQDAAALTPPAAAESRDDALAALNQAEFGARVREALRALDDPLTLGKNALLHCRAVELQSPASATNQERAAVLRALLLREIAGLQGSKRGDQCARVLQAAYVDTMGKHESIARTLGMSYSTFRRLLAAGTEHIVAAVWARTQG